MSMLVSARVVLPLLFLARGAEALSLPAVTAPKGATDAAPTRVRVSHILVDSEGLADECVSLLEKGTAFAELAESVSTCDSKSRGGDLGWITPGLMVPEFDAAAFTFPPGEVVTVQSDFGWHVVCVAEANYVPDDMSPAELRARLMAGDCEGDAPSLQLIDLRDDEERTKAMIPNAPFRHLPYLKWQTWAEQAIAGTLEPPIDKGVEVLFMDHRGGRAERIMQYLAQAGGFVKGRYLHGGINSYAEEADPSVPVYLESDGDCLTCKEH